MIALWSRAIRNPGTCRCIFCASNTSTAATTRAGAIALKSAWAFGTPTSTFLYTAVFAAGLAMDAKAKHNRNERWDTAFSSLREEMRRAPAGGGTACSSHRGDVAHAGEPIPTGLDWDAVSKAIGMDLIDDTVLEKRQTEAVILDIPEILWDLLPLDARFPRPTMLDWPANTGPGLGSRYNLPPQSLWALEGVRWKAMRNRHTRKKLAVQELSVCALIHDLLGYFGKNSPAHEEAFLSLSPHVARVVNLNAYEAQKARHEIRVNITALESVKLDDWPEDTMCARTSPKLLAEPQYMQDSDGDYHHIAAQLNMAIKNLFEEYQDKHSDIKEMSLATAKICHNLLISSTAPNLQTFNILLAGFIRWKQPLLADCAIKALDDCKIRPNEITCAAILDHYAETERPDPFSRFVAKMRGAGDALMLANPNITVNEKGEGRLVRVSETKVYQKVYPTPMVFHALMHGVLKFAGFERAMDIYYEMKEDGWGLDIQGLSRFLNDCVHRADWQGGLLVWEEIASIKGRIKPDYLAKAYALFLSLCSVTGKTAAFNSVLNDVVRRGYDRKALLKSAGEIAFTARPQKGYLAPAWTADNLLIAVSDYMNNEETTETKTAPLFDEMNADSIPKNEESQEQRSVSADDAWNAWMEHELGVSATKDASKTTPSEESKTKPSKYS